MATSYAILFMAHLEKKLLEYPKGPRIWKRYVDDIITVYEHGEAELLKFLTHLNSSHPTIKFTYEYSTNTINFLDVQVTKNEQGFLTTDLYTKPTDSHAYLNFSSCHPRHIVNSIQFSQAIRLRRICSKENQLKTRLRDLKQNLLARSFPARLVQCSINISALPPTEKKKKNNSDPIDPDVRSKKKEHEHTCHQQ